MDDIPLTYQNLSWLSFNHRVLQEAMDQSVPLYERIKFLAIYSSNLDEFFRVRVAALRSFKDLKKKTRKALEVKPKKELKQIRKIVYRQQQTFGRIFREEIIPALLEEGISLISNEAYTAEQRQFTRNYFFEKICPQIQPLDINPKKTNLPFLQNKALYFIVTFPDTMDLVLVEIPSSTLPRFLELPVADEGVHAITFLDDIIRQNIEELLNRTIKNAYAIKLSRDAEIYIEDEFSGNLVTKIKKGLEKRNIGTPTRFLYDSSMDKELLNRLMQIFNLTKNDIIPGARYHNFNDFFDFPNPSKKDALHYPAFPPLPHPILEAADSIREIISERDVILHFPYQRYDYVTRLIREAAHDSKVQSLKITLYRVANKSAIVEALLEALKRGKEVVVFIEAKARFDEASNLYQGEELEKAGAKVIYSYPDIKVHTKLFLFKRDEEEGVRHYAYLGTGNFNEKTARVYCDHALLTANQNITRETEQVFALLEKRIIIPRCKHLLVAPFSLRTSITELIDKEIKQAKAGKKAYIILKVNNLEDPKIIRKLYEASQAGVNIQIIVRSICCLQPGIQGYSENIKIISIVDRFLEHARVYLFGNGGKELMYIASADWMTRNLDRRVEVAIPIYDPAVFQEIREVINFQLRDNQKARYLTAEMVNAYKKPLPKERPVRAQVDIYRLLEKK